MEQGRNDLARESGNKPVSAEMASSALTLAHKATRVMVTVNGVTSVVTLCKMLNLPWQTPRA